MTRIPLPLADDDGRVRLVRDLGGRIRGEVRVDRHDRMLYATDASIYQVEPLGVVIPRDVDDVRIAVAFCAEHGLPLVPRGGGTSLAGQVLNRAVIIDFSAHCRALVSVGVERRRAVVEPGIVLDHLNDALRPHGLMFGPDVATASHANVGGMIGNNSAGARSLLYGRTVEHVLELDVVLADGSAARLAPGADLTDPRVADLTRRVMAVVRPLEGLIDARFPTIRRHVDGYNLDLMLAQHRASTPGTFDAVNLAHLVTGSEGTLAVTTGATLNLVPRPDAQGLAIAGFASVDEALGALDAVLGTAPAAVELLDDVVLGLAAMNAKTSPALDLMPRLDRERPAAAVLYVEYGRDTPDAVDAAFDVLDATLGQRVRRYTDPDSTGAAWALRKAGEALLCGMSARRKPLTFIEDLAVEPRRLREFVQRFQALVARHGTSAAYYAHASVGCLHIRPLVDLHDPADVRMMEAIATDATDLVREFGGALSGEHGDGRLRSHLLERYFGRELCDGFRAIKAIFDPEGRLNPGNIVEPVPMAAALRVRPEDAPVRMPEVSTYFRYERDGGFGAAVEACNGAGFCRRTSGGTMCPSYRATRDERHATRGRGNALRLAISGQCSSDGASPRWDDPDTMATLDLCLSCKACKTECPSNVDIARLKAEYAAQRFDAAGRVPLSTRLIGHVRRLNRIGSVAPTIANALTSSRVVRAGLERWCGLDARRPLPRAEPSLYSWFEHREESRRDGPAVILFPDCFTVYTEPRIGRASVRVLEAMGYRVVLPRLGCCGRAMISVGMLGAAIETCRATAEALLTCVDGTDAVAVVGAEPSCVSAIRDDWLDLRLGLPDERLGGLAARTMLVETFVDERWETSPVTPAAGACAGALVLHGHCHQKALWGVETSSSAVARVAGVGLHVLPTGCCGMAGSFGATTRGYDLSLEIAEMDLFARLDEHPEATVVAPGTSCRQQVRDGRGRKAVHPIEVIAGAMGVGEGIE